MTRPQREHDLVDGALARCTDDIAFTANAPVDLLPHMGHRHGKAAMREMWTAVHARYSEMRCEVPIIVAEGDYIACQTWIEGTFARPFTRSPAGRLEPTGARVVMDLMNLFRFDDEGRLVEEYVRTDNRSLLRQLGTEGA